MSRNKIIIVTIVALLSICCCLAITLKIRKLSVNSKLIPAPPPPIKKVQKTSITPKLQITKKENITENIKDVINSYPEGKARNEFVEEIDTGLEKYIEKISKELASAEEPYPEDSPKVKLLEDLKNMQGSMPKD